MIILAAAVGLNHELGRKDGKPLWDLPDEYNQFREHIRSHPIIMGRRSFDVIKEPLKGSLNIVVTRQKDYDGKGAVVVHSLGEALQEVESEKIIYVIGGGEIFKEIIGRADKIELSRIQGTFPEADVFFPEFSADKWQLITSERHEKDKRNSYSFTCETWITK